MWKKITEEVEEGQGPAAEVSHPQDGHGRPQDIHQSGIDHDHKINCEGKLTSFIDNTLYRDLLLM